MMWHSRHRASLIGVDVGSRQIKLAQLTGGDRLVAHAVLDRCDGCGAPSPDEVLRIRTALERRGFRGNRIAIAASPEMLRCEMFDLPPRSSGAPVDRIARAEIARMARLGQDRFEMALWDLPAPARSSGSCSVMAVALREADALSLLDPFEDAGLNVVALDAPACALAHGGLACGMRPSGITALLDVGASGSTLILLGDRDILYQRVLAECGVEALYREITGRFGVSDQAAEFLVTSSDGQPTADEEHGSRWQWITEQIQQYAGALAHELRASFAYARHRYPDLSVVSLRLAGGGAGVRGLGGQLSQTLGVECRELTRSDLGLAGDAEPADRTALLALAIGLARHEGD